MGTKIQANAFFPEYHSVTDLNGNTSNGMMRSLYHDDLIPKNGPFTAQIRKNRYLGLGYDMEKMRQTILEHESIFKNQLQELHRLYGRQRELMNEMKKRETKKDELTDKRLPVLLPPKDPRSLRTFEPHLFTSGVFSKGTDNIYTGNNNQASYDTDTKLSLSAVQTSQPNSDALGFDLYFKKTNPNKDRLSDDLTSSRGDSSANPCSGFNLVMKDFFQTSPSGKEHLSEDYAVNFAENRRFDKSLASPRSLLAEPRKELSHCPYTGTSVSRKKKKIFGLEISDGDEYPFNAASNISSTFDSNIKPHVSFKPSSWVANSCMQNLNFGGTNVKNDGEKEKPTADLKGEISSQEGFTSIGSNFRNMSYQGTEINSRKCFKSLDGTKSNQENPKSGLPWFLKNPQASDDVSKTNRSLYVMNLDSLQNYSEFFFGKAENAEGKFQSLKQKIEISTQIVNHTGAEKNIGDDDSTRKSEKYENVQTNLAENKDLVLHYEGLNNRKAFLRHDIDLNLSFDEDDAPSAPSVPTATVKIATAEIDLEVPLVIESQVSYEECEKIAAEAIIDISSSAKKNSVDNKSCDERLKWFADIISSDRSGPHCEVESIPNGMDYFEFMTLKLEDMKEQQHCHEPFTKTPISDSGNEETRLSKRPRRGRQRRDFHRDILPGLVTLSRLEVTEDFQAFEELLKAEGPSQQVLVRNGRGRKRLGGRNASPTAKVVRSGRAQRAVCQLEERSLTGWGKRTRRLPRQRCAGPLLAFTVKC